MDRCAEKDGLDTGCTGDFARIEADGEHITLEANEWDREFCGFRSVTLYLTTSEARSLAGALARTVIEIEADKLADSDSARRIQA
jgi:hypothetical protein